MSHTRESIKKTVIAVVSEQFGIDANDIGRDTKFVQDLNIDSLDTVELIMELEDEFDISIDDGDADKLGYEATVGDAIDAMCGLLGVGAPERQTPVDPDQTQMFDEGSNE